MSQRSARPPVYPRQPHASGQARIKIHGKTYYLGVWGSPESRAEYRRLLAEWEAGTTPRQRNERSALTVGQVVTAYAEHARTVKYQRNPDQWRKSERALAFVLDLYGPRPVNDFDQDALELVQRDLVKEGYARTYINDLVGRIRRAWKWAAKKKLIPSELYADLCLVEDLAKGQTDARESRKIKPVPWEWVEKTLPYLLPPVKAMVQLQWLTGMRTGEVTRLRACDIGADHDVWVYRPPQHKTAHLGQERSILLGPLCQSILRPFLACRPADAYVFDPREALEWKALDAREKRKTKVQPSQQKRNAERARRRRERSPLRDHYDAMTYSRAVARAAKRAGVPHWHPYQLRHAAATRIRAEYGPDAARAILGHKSLQATEIYADVDLGKVSEIMRRSG